MTDQSFLDDLIGVESTQPTATHVAIETPSPTPSNVSQRRKRPTSKATTLSSHSVTPSPAPSSCGSAKQSAIQLLESLHLKAQSVQADRFSAFGELIAGHLRRLNADQAILMESTISQAMYGCLHSFQAPTASTQKTPVPPNYVFLDIQGNVLGDADNASVIVNAIQPIPAGMTPTSIAVQLDAPATSNAVQLDAPATSNAMQLDAPSSSNAVQLDAPSTSNVGPTVSTFFRPRACRSSGLRQPPQNAEKQAMVLLTPLSSPLVLR